MYQHWHMVIEKANYDEFGVNAYLRYIIYVSSIYIFWKSFFFCLWLKSLDMS